MDWRVLHRHGRALALYHALLLGGALLCIGAAFLLLGGSAQAWPTLPPWRRIGSAAGIVAGLAFLIASLITTGL